MLILGIDRQTTSDSVVGMCSDTELLSRYELRHQRVTGRPAGVMANPDPEQDIRVKIAHQRAERNSRIKAARRATAARLAGVMA
jgi:hypothetical protein